MTDADAEETDPHAASVHKLANAMLRTAVWPAIGVGVVAVVVAALTVGSDGLFGALVGAGVGLGSSLLTIGMMKASAGLPVMLVMSVALGGYLVKLLLLLLAMTLLRDVAALHPASLALTFLAIILVTAAAEVIAFKRTKIPTLVV